MAKLLVSVRSAIEAEAALAGGAALIDVKEPAHGSLGRATDASIAAVLRCVAGRQPVSAALGEWADDPRPLLVEGLRYVKGGLAGCEGRRDWRSGLMAARVQLQKAAPECGLVAVAYADWKRAESPPPLQVCEFACESRCAAFLVDTWHKDGTTLLDWLATDAVSDLVGRCRRTSVRVALAGSLGPAEIRLLRATEPDWFAVRGAVCRSGQRGQTVEVEAVRQLADLLAIGEVDPGHGGPADLSRQQRHDAHRSARG
jgi:uncharacterized protein (UPF0264 family)